MKTIQILIFRLNFLKKVVRKGLDFSFLYKTSSVFNINSNEIYIHIYIVFQLNNF